MIRTTARGSKSKKGSHTDEFMTFWNVRDVAANLMVMRMTCLGCGMGVSLQSLYEMKMFKEMIAVLVND